MIEKKNVLFIVNPISGGKKITDFQSVVEKNLDTDLFHFEIYHTTGRGDATIKVKEGYDKFDIVVAVGGDGTINEVVKGLIGTDTAMGVIPKGSGNGFANYFSIPHDPARAIRRINKHRSVKIDTATFNGALFLSVAGLGFDATVAQAFDHFGSRGFLSYARITIREYARFSPQSYTINIDGKSLNEKALLVVVANSTQFGNNAFIAPNAEIDDGWLDVVILRPFKFWQMMPIMFRLFNKTIDQSKYCKVYRGKDIRINCHDEIAQLDGEPIVALPENIIKIVPASLNMIV